jgi:hypothetical protein
LPSNRSIKITARNICILETRSEIHPLKGTKIFKHLRQYSEGITIRWVWVIDKVLEPPLVGVV